MKLMIYAHHTPDSANVLSKVLNTKINNLVKCRKNVRKLPHEPHLQKKQPVRCVKIQSYSINMNQN